MNVVSQFENDQFPRHRPLQFSLRQKMDLCQAIFYRLKSIISSKSPPHEISNDVNRNPREARRKKLYVWCVNLDFGEIFVAYD